MIILLRRLRSNAQAATIVEFALVAPVLLGLVFGVLETGRLFLANAGLKSAVEDATRYATIWPRPSESAITSRITDHRFGLNPADIVGPTVVFTDASPDYVTISMTYNYDLNYVLGSRTIALTETRRGYVTD